MALVIFFLFLIITLSIILIYNTYSRLVISLIILEFIGITILFSRVLLASESFTVMVLCFLVVEAVLGLVGLIGLVSYSGGDYLVTSVINIL